MRLAPLLAVVLIMGGFGAWARKGGSHESGSKEQGVSMGSPSKEKESKENASKGKTSKEKESKEKSSKDKNSKEKTSTENAPEEKSSKEKKSKEKVSREKASKEASKKKASKEKVSKEKASKEKDSKEMASKEKASKEKKGSKEKVSRVKASKEKVSKEKVSKKKNSKEKISKEKGSKEKVSKERVSKEKVSKEKAPKGKASKERTSEERDSHSHEGKTQVHGKCTLCRDIYNRNKNAKDKVYSLRIWDPIAKRQRKVKAFCDMTHGGYTIFQRRLNGSVSFAEDWTPYKKGFGDKEGSYWLGNDNIHLITTYCGCQTLRVFLQSCNGYRVVSEIGDELSGYEAAVSGAPNTAFPAHDPFMAKGGKGINGIRFSTYGVDNDRHPGHCSAAWGRGGFWFNACGYANLNGPIGGACSNSHKSMSWYGWPIGGWKGLRRASMGLIYVGSDTPTPHIH